MKDRLLHSFEENYLSSKKINGQLTMQGGILDDEIIGYSFQDCSISDGSFSCSTFTKCSFINTHFLRVHFDHVIFKNCEFQNVIIDQGSTDKMKMENCIGSPVIHNNSSFQKK